MKRAGLYNYKIQKHDTLEKMEILGYKYEIYTCDAVPLLIFSSEEWFEGAGDAEFAALGHISIIEKGDGK